METLDINRLAYNKDDTILVQTNQEISDQLKALEIDMRSNDQLQQAALSLGDSAELLKLQKLRLQMTDARNELERRLSNLTLNAPFDGIFESNLNALAHTIISSGDPIGRFIDPSVYQVVIEILERDIEGIQPKTQAYFILNNQPDVIFAGKVTRISPRNIMRGIARFYRVSVEFPNKNKALREGMAGTVYLEIGNYTYLYRLVRWLKKTIRLDLQL
ncbi:MAG: Peptidase M50 [Candidatus Magnetoglobus multicellularis str. Araruama]|uniref:Peptidase M50 n=1 Tax=Candidatus Magnetoglobus multicellularis str. Araruama TaxID=890399 RepID=A0A1V1P6N7_9BACT|nr:MAG: Peptidase M50 [Candidatus Magnetoglobus multicellularis str. Araruama]